MAFPSVNPGQWVQAGLSAQAAGVQWLPDGVHDATTLFGGNNGWPILPNLFGGGVFDTDHDDYIYDAAGGHADYPGNEVYALNVNTQTWSLRRVGTSLGTPSVLIPSNPALSLPNHYTDTGGVFGPVNQVYPASTHRYGQSCYLRGTGKILHIGGGTWGNSSQISSDVYLCDPRASTLSATWTALALTQAPDLQPLSSSCTYNPIDGFAYYYNRSYVFRINVVTGAHSAIDHGNGQTSSNANGAVTIVVDQKRQRIYRIGPQGSASLTPGMSYHDLFHPVGGFCDAINFPVSGATELVNIGDMQGIYDEVRDRLVYYNAGLGAGREASVYFVNPDTGVITREDGTGTPPPAGNLSNGPWGNFFRSVTNDAYGLITSFTAAPFYYRPADSSKTFTLSAGALTKWTAEGGIHRVDHGNGAPGGAAGGVSTSVQDKFERGVFDTTRNKITIVGGNAIWLGVTVRGQSTVLQIDDATATPTWSSLTELIEGPSRSQPSAPENPLFVYDGPQVGQATPGRDRFYMARGGYNSPPDTQNQAIAAAAGVTPATPIFDEATLTPSIPSWAESGWGTPSWGHGGDSITTNSGYYDRASDSWWRTFGAGAGAFVERHIIGTDHWVKYVIGAFDQGNGETDLSDGSCDFHREALKGDPIGQKFYVMNNTHNKLFQFDIAKARALDDVGSPTGTVVTPPNAGADYCKEYTIPGVVHCHLGGFDATHLHCAMDFDQLNRRLLMMLIGGTAGDGYKFLAFNPAAVTTASGTEAFEDLGITSTDYPGGFLEGQYPHGDWAVYNSAKNTFVIMGGKISGNESARSPSWTPASGSFSVVNATYQGTWNLVQGEGGNPLDFCVFGSDGTVYTRGVHYTATNDGTTTTFTNIGGMTATVTIAYYVGVPVAFTHYRYWGGPGAAVPTSTLPAVTALSPASCLPGAATFLLTVFGTTFTADCVVNWAGAPLTGTTFVNAGQLTVPIPAALVTTEGAFTISVTNSVGTSTTNKVFNVTWGIATLSLVYNDKIRDRVGAGDTALAPDGFLDGVLTATLNGGGHGRTITALALTAAGPSGGAWDTTLNTNWVLGAALTTDGAYLNNATTMAVNFTVADGGSFVVFASDQPGSAVYLVPGAPLTLTATLSDGLTAVGTVTIGSGNPVPTLISLDPTVGYLGNPAFTMNVYGTNFVAGANVNYNGGSRATTFVTSGIVQATILATDLLALGPASVTVTNPAPGGGTSPALTFTVLPVTQTGTFVSAVM